ncbi:DUF5367 family protein [uncultured Psychroserpens sp.]|uniref:DUF5367 family protein n=1 Tax=uncultured Psychroserpens sp. TaxID=255436 RepID=UPI0026191B39|nr:DUF5367 family protein [uncultured Psychroserpens sp.]
MKTIKAIIIGIGIWILAVSFYTLSFQFQIFEDANQQANMVLFSIVIPLVWLGSFLYYKKGSKIHGYFVGQIFLLVAAFLDALITVPFFVIPNGGSHYSFFTDFGFWTIALEILVITILYYYTIVYPKTKSLKPN